MGKVEVVSFWQKNRRKFAMTGLWTPPVAVTAFGVEEIISGLVSKDSERVRGGSYIAAIGVSMGLRPAGQH